MFEVNVKFKTPLSGKQLFDSFKRGPEILGDYKLHTSIIGYGARGSSVNIEPNNFEVELKKRLFKRYAIPTISIPSSIAATVYGGLTFDPSFFMVGLMSIPASISTLAMSYHHKISARIHLDEEYSNIKVKANNLQDLKQLLEQPAFANLIEPRKW